MDKKYILKKLLDMSEVKYPRHYQSDIYEYHRKAYMEGVKDAIDLIEQLT